MQNDPRTLGDPAAIDALRAAVADAGPAGAEAAAELLAGLSQALAGAVGDAFTLCAAVTALSLVVALFIGTPRPTSENGG